MPWLQLLRSMPAVSAVFAANTAFAALVLLALRGDFVADRFAYHDLGLISDFLASTAWGRGFFWLANESVNHLGWHFTPSLAVWAPFFRVFDSDFLLLALGTLSGWLACWIALRIFSRFHRLGAGLGVFLAACFWLNPFALRVLYSAHFEMLYWVFAGMAILSLMERQSLWRALPWSMLAIGVREDAGTYLFCQLPLLLLPEVSGSQGWTPAQKRTLRRAVSVLCLLCVLWVALVVKVITPAFGTPDEFTVRRYWHEFGSTWGEFFWNVLRQPGLVLRRTFSSALPEFWKTFLYLPAFASYGLGLVLASLPAGMMVISANADKSGLTYYNSALLFPGFWLASSAGLWAIARRWRHARRGVAAVAALLVLAGAVEAVGTWKSKALPLRSGHPCYAWLDDWVSGQRMLRPRMSIANDFRREVRVPHSVERYLLERWKEADAIFLPLELDPMRLPLEMRDRSAWLKATEVERAALGFVGVELPAECAGFGLWMRK